MKCLTESIKKGKGKMRLQSKIFVFLVALALFSFGLDIATTEIGLAHGLHEYTAALAFYTMTRPIAYLWGMEPWLVPAILLSIVYVIANKGKIMFSKPRVSNVALWGCVIGMILVTFPFAVFNHLDGGLDNLIYLIQKGIL